MAEDLQQRSDSADASTPSNSSTQKRNRALKLLAIIVLLATVIYLCWVWLNSDTVETDNAYVNAESAAVTSMLSAQVATVLVKDTQSVHQGDILLRLNDQDAKIALAQAQAQLAKAQRQYQQTKANSTALDSQVLVSNDGILSAQAQLAKAQADYDKAMLDFQRRAQLVASGAVSKEELSTARTATNTAKAALKVAQANLAQAQSSKQAAQGNLDANNALIQGTSEQDSPDVLVAKANVAQAKLDLARTVIRAPIDGIIAQRSVQVGQRIAPGSVLMKIVPIQQLYVDANFKESQLSDVRVGQRVELSSDYYGKDVRYHGTVIGFAGGTGSAFALIPAQNATGNWIKVVQRLPVRIQLMPNELSAHPLRVGLSMRARIDLSSTPRHD